MNNETRTVLTIDELKEKAPSVFATSAHPSVSGNYKFIPTIEMLETLMTQGWEVVQAGEHKVRKAGKAGYQKHLIRLRNPNLPMVNDSEVDLLVYNSHDRTSAFKFLAGVYRFVCANGMVTGQDLFKPISVRHIGYKATNVIEASYRVIESVPQITESINAMNTIELTQDEKLTFGKQAIIAKYGPQTIDKDTGVTIPYPVTPELVILPNREADQGNSLWNTFNVIQENLVKGGQKDWYSGRRMTREVKSIDKSTQLNQKLWMLAEDFKKFKTA